MKRCWVSVTLEGLNLERLVQRMGEQGIPLRRMKRPASRMMAALVPEDRLAALQILAQEGGWQLTPGRRHGAGRMVDLLMQQWGVTMFAALMLVCALLAANVMWRVEVTNGGVYRADILNCLGEQGVRAPMWKRHVDLDMLREMLTWRYPALARVDCGWRGMTLCISVNEGTAQGETINYTEGAGSVVASRDGIIDSVVTYAGTPLVKHGDLVKKGQVLIEGTERRAAESSDVIRADGVVMARVWDGTAVRMPLTELETIYSGRIQQTVNVTTPVFDLWAQAPDDFAAMDVHTQRQPLGGLFWPLTIQREERREATLVTRQRQMADVKAQAALAAMRKLRQKVGAEAEILDKWVEYSMINDGELQAVAVCERLVDIALAVPQNAPAGLPRAQGQ